jgi:hypothetical protein
VIQVQCRATHAPDASVALRMRALAVRRGKASNRQSSRARISVLGRSARDQRPPFCVQKIVTCMTWHGVACIRAAVVYMSLKLHNNPGRDRDRDLTCCGKPTDAPIRAPCGNKITWSSVDWDPWAWGHGVVYLATATSFRLLVFVNDGIRLCAAVWMPDKCCSGHGVVSFGDNVVRLLVFVHFVFVDDGPTCGRRFGNRMGDGLELKRECIHPAGICTVVLH